MITLIGSVIVFLLVVFLHELGHFSVAKFVGIKVDEFSIGMGPQIFQTQKGETKYTLRLLPIGGYVAMDGEDEHSDNPRGFSNVSVFKRMAVVVAGVIMNFILAVVAFFIIALFMGSATNKIGNVIENSPAQYAGIRSGDEIVEINQNKVTSWEDVLTYIAPTQEGEVINVKIQRDGVILEEEIEPLYENGRSYIGIESKVEKSFVKAIRYGFENTIYVIKNVFYSLKMLIQGGVSADMFSGPVGVIQIIGQETAKGPLYLLNILGIISANLAVMNLLPIPALDGGKLVLLIYEAIFKRKVNENLEFRLSQIGFTILMSLMLYITVFGDLKRIIGW